VHNFSKLFIHSRSIVGDFKMHNYRTYWISNQGTAGKHDSSIASMAQEADIYHFENLNYSSAKPDEHILPYLSNIKNNPDKEMYFIHLIGSHGKYVKRYTKKHILFQNALNIIDEYDNTIYYTDYILKEIFNYFKNKFQKKKILIVYISDHGEVVSENKHGHAYLPPFKDEYDIPFVIYSSIKNDRVDKLYENNKKRYFNLENLNYMIEYISGISEDCNISYSSDVFALEPNNIFDYNKLEYYKD
jgi:heptose-I-phosphate ethanolaminephosphotransferase